ncbi:MAG: methylenetetrahydrofolate reductase [Candidatus Omnitrophota bacterium]|nr:MAG: methylenetetrahydrofolate reductase [Candidatus Omnitrophota bacterium]
MSRISVELVPRHKEAFISELKLVKDTFSCVDTINIPDIVRYDLRSLEACELVKPLFNCAIPHLRAGSIHREKPISFKSFLTEFGINEVLLVLGDHRDENILGCTTIELIRKFKIDLPQVKVYAGIDPYRSSFEAEYAYIQEKISAGADGFFTQPFFDLNLLETYAKKLSNLKIFWGVSPVLTRRAQNYWETKNKVVFPKGFVPEMSWNRKFALSVLDFSKASNTHIYFMPIKADLKEYLEGIIF